MSKQCQNCRINFEVGSDDLAFYQKISVPPPTWCSDCRMQRRMAHRNERALYRDICDMCGKRILSMYSADKPSKVFCKECWHSDGWDPTEFGAPYDWSKPFFEQYWGLSRQVPRAALFAIRENVNADYSNFVVDNKNVYLSFSVVGCEDVYYCRSIDKSRNCFDCLNIKESEMCYENIDCSRNYRTSFAIRSRECIDSMFLFDCVNCQNCYMSSNLRNKRFVFRNKQLSEEQYREEMKFVNLDDHQELERLKEEFRALLLKSLRKFANTTKTVNCSGDNVENSKSVHLSFDVYGVENARYCARLIPGAKDCYDVYGGASELLYEGTASGFGTYNVKFFLYIDAAQQSQYVDWCFGSSNLFGCIGLRKKEYCILNKQYTKEEYVELLPRITAHMNNVPYMGKNGRIYKYGEFFPMEISSWAYNETLANEYFPLSKEETRSRGYSWREPDPYTHKTTVLSENLPNRNVDAGDTMVNEVIQCGKCDRAYRIVKAEFDFLNGCNLSLPRACPECRHKERFLLRNPLRLWGRRCMCAGDDSENKIWKNTATHFHKSERCPNEFETSYAPNRPEIVYCEACYNAEVA